MSSFVEARKVAKADNLGHLGDGDVTGGQKHLGLLEPDPHEVIAGGSFQDPRNRGETRVYRLNSQLQGFLLALPKFP